MENTFEFLSLVLDTITEQIVVIDSLGNIQFVNKSWTTFGDNNGCVIGSDWSGVNYLKECDKSSAAGDNFGTLAANGIRSVIEKQKNTFYFEYPCHSLDENRWFMMRTTPFSTAGKNYFVISHQNITERKNAEEAVENLANIDGLTQIFNRRYFNEFLDEEWRRHSRLKKPISLAIIDIDHFKLINDTYGHQTGDECLTKVCALLKKSVNRPGDICARYGGEEFVLVLGSTPLEQAKQLLIKLHHDISSLGIPNEKSPTEKYLTVSIGLAS